jgi:hypothetical protein
MSELDRLLLDIEQAETSSHARKDWHPQQLGSIDIRIATDGTWFHEGRPFKRLALVKLFASVLRREGDSYYLLTPAEKLRVQVDDAPFVATTMQTLSHNNQQVLVFTTTLGDTIVADKQHPIRVETVSASQPPRPYIRYRDGLDALISRTAFFDLASAADELERDGQVYLVVHSMGVEFNLGACSDELTP